MENKEFNLYDLSNGSSAYYRRQSKLEENAKNALDEYTANLINEQKTAEETKLNEALAAAKFDHASKYQRINDRTRSLEEEIKYNENASIIGMTEMVANVVEKGLLLDEAEFAKIDPNYKTEIREIISNFLKESEINSDITNKDTLTLMEHVYKSLPSVKEGKNLNEAAIQNIVNSRAVDVDTAINNLSGNVGNRVASLMEKEQQRVEEINKEVGKSDIPAEEAEAIDPEEILNGLLSGEISTEEVDQMAEEGAIDEDTYNQLIDAYNEEIGAQQEQEAPTEEVADGEGTAGLTPKKQIQMTPDGTLSINIFESADAEAEVAPRAQIQMSPDGTLVASDENKQVAVGPDGEMEIDIMESISYAVSNYYEYEDYLQEGIVTDFDLGKWSPEMEVEKKYTQKGRVFGTIIGWFFGGVIGAFLKVLFPGSGSVMKKIGVALANAIKGSQASSDAAVSTVEKAGNAGGIGGAVIVGAAAGAAVGHYIGRKINARINRKKIKALIELCSKDEKCNDIISDMRKAIENEDTEAMKKLREQFALRLDELKNKVTVANGYFKEPVKYTSVYTENLVREVPRSGLIETLAVNEARQMIKEGKEYNSDYCLAKAIMYTTITEAMNEMGLMNIDDKAYSQIISAAGGVIVKETTVEEFTNKSKAEETNENKARAYAINKKRTGMGYTDDKGGIKTYKNGRLVQNFAESLQEHILINQYNDPVNNNGGIDFGERIRQRKLMKEQQTINE